MNRRAFLTGAILTTALRAQRPAATPAPGAPMPPPPAAKITSSAMLWTLKGSFEDRVAIAAKAGIQAIELLNEYSHWDDAAMARARKFVNSFGMNIDAIVAADDFDRTVACARALNCPRVILRKPVDLKPVAIAAEKANLTALIEFGDLAARVNMVKEAATPHLRAAISLLPGTPTESFKETLDYTAIVHIGDDIAADDIYRAIRSSNYSGLITLEYAPAGDPVASFIATIDKFRVALLERPAPVSS